MGLGGQRFMKAGLTSKTCGKGSTECLGLFHVIVHPVPIQQGDHICPSLRFAADVLLESFVVLNIPSKISRKVRLGSPKSPCKLRQLLHTSPKQVTNPIFHLFRIHFYVF